MSQPVRITTDNELLHNTYSVRLRDAVRSVFDNFIAIMRLARIDKEHQMTSSTTAAHDMQQMQVRAANMVRQSETLMRLIADVKESLILNDFGQINEIQAERARLLADIQSQTRQELLVLRDELSDAVRELEMEATPRIHTQSRQL